MADEKILKDETPKDNILKDEILKDEQLEQVAGGAFRMFEPTPNTANDQNTPSNQLGAIKIHHVSHGIV